MNILAAHNVNSLSAMLWRMTGIAITKALGCAFAMLQTPSRQRHG